MRPAVIDIAREAGVSLATVDRVLNERPSVREKTILAVSDAITKLGNKMNVEFVPWTNFTDRMLNELNSGGKLCDLMIGDSRQRCRKQPIC